jgi:hypothetical protein
VIVLKQVGSQVLPAPVLVIVVALLLATSSAGIPAQSVSLTPYTAPDQSVSAGVPPGWTVTKGGDTAVVMTGTRGETIFLGDTIVARNAPYVAGQRSDNGIDIYMPYSSTLAQKFTMIIEQGVALAGGQPPQLKIASSTPIAMPPALGQCGRFVADGTSIVGPIRVMASVCSLPLDSGGTYKNILLMAQAPTVIAAQDAPIAQAVFASYRVPAAMLQRKLAPFTAPPVVMASPGAARMPAIPPAALGGDTSQCFDLVVIRETPKNQLPISCGGTRPN